MVQTYIVWVEREDKEKTAFSTKKTINEAIAENESGGIKIYCLGMKLVGNGK
jgi:hypothetical protein